MIQLQSGNYNLDKYHLQIYTHKQTCVLDVYRSI